MIPVHDDVSHIQSQCDAASSTIESVLTECVHDDIESGYHGDAPVDGKERLTSVTDYDVQPIPVCSGFMIPCATWSPTELPER